MPHVAARNAARAVALRHVRAALAARVSEPGAIDGAGGAKWAGRRLSRRRGCSVKKDDRDERHDNSRSPQRPRQAAPSRRAPSSACRRRVTAGRLVSSDVAKRTLAITRGCQPSRRRSMKSWLCSRRSCRSDGHRPFPAGWHHSGSPAVGASAARQIRSVSRGAGLARLARSNARGGAIPPSRLGPTPPTPSGHRTS